MGSLVSGLRARFGVGGKASYRLGLELHDDGIAWAIGPADGSRILNIGYESCLPDKHQEALEALVQEHHLKKAEVFISLMTEQYQSFPVESPNVPAEELASAVRWKLKDSLDYDLGEAIVDVFDFPHEPAGGRGRLVHGVAAHRSMLTQAVHLVHESGLSLQKIDIAELALRNLAYRLDPQGEGFALVYLRNSVGLLILGQGHVLFLARRVNFRLSMMADAQQQDASIQSLALEIQRSLDYYESQLRQRPPRSLYVQAADDQYPLANMLANYLAIGVEPFASSDILGMESGTEPGESLLAAGAVLQIPEEQI